MSTIYLESLNDNVNKTRAIDQEVYDPYLIDKLTLNQGRTTPVH